MNIDRKFIIDAKNATTGVEYNQHNSLLLCAKDKAVPAALKAYLEECIRLGSNHEHLESINLLIDRIEEYQKTVYSKVPDTLGEEIPRCIDGIE